MYSCSHLHTHTYTAWEGMYTTVIVHGRTVSDITYLRSLRDDVQGCSGRTVLDKTYTWEVMYTTVIMAEQTVFTYVPSMTVCQSSLCLCGGGGGRGDTVPGKIRNSLCIAKKSLHVVESLCRTRVYGICMCGGCCTKTYAHLVCTGIEMYRQVSNQPTSLACNRAT